MKRITWLPSLHAAAFQLTALLLASSVLWAQEVRTFTRTISADRDEYVIEVGGRGQPENVEITIENLGESAVKDPRVTVNGRCDWFDIEAMVEEILSEGYRTDRERALAIWEWVHWKRFQRSPVDRSSLHPVRALNGYGYGICGHTAAWLKALWTAAGLEARVQEIWGHTISEVYYEGGWHMLDGNVKVFYTARDNRTIASLAELEQDGWLIERTIHPRDPWNRPEDPPGRNEEFVRYIVTTGDNYEEDGYDDEIAKHYTMSYTLRPGEKLIRWWGPELGKYESRHERPLFPQRYANGRLVWEPDPEKTDLLDYINVIENITTRQQDSRSPSIHVEQLQSDNYTRPSRFTISVNSAYPVIGGALHASLLKDPGASASVFYGEPGWGSGDLYTYRWGSGPQEIDVYLDSKLLEDAPVYDYEIGFTVKGDERRDSQAGVESFRLVSDLQVSPHSLPALRRGRNVVVYRDNSAGAGRKVRITHKWRENNQNAAPGTVTRAVAPSPAAAVSTLTPTLEWEPARDLDKDDTVTDYQVMVSLYPECRWPVSMSLYRNVGSDACRWTVPESFLNPGATYYWKVRARDSHGAVGEWGEVFSFTTSGSAE